MPSFQLVVRRGPKSGETFELKAQTVIIGRDSTADIIINDPEVSRNHCRLILDRSYYLQDLGSTNGTFVDGQRLGGEPVRLSNGQILQLGSNVTLLYQETELGDVIVSTMMAGNSSADEAIDKKEESLGSNTPDPRPRRDPMPPNRGFERESQLPKTGGLEPAPMPSFEEMESLPQFNAPPQRESTPEPAMPSSIESDFQPPAANNHNDVPLAPAPQAQNSNYQNSNYQPASTVFPSDAAADVAVEKESEGGFLPDWTRRQWIIASSVLGVVLLCACCFFIIATVVILQNNGVIPAF